MFGNNAITSSWTNPQQNQPQQPGTSAFGQPTSTFGSTGFGSSTGAFGQPQQQQPANPMFGGLGGTSNTNTGGFGAFGGSNNPTGNTASSAFGAPKPATGFGAFGGGGTSAFGNTGGTSAFGNTAQTSSAFGQPASTSAFGSGTGGGIFGQPKPTSAFGTPAANNATGPVTAGSSNPPYSATSDKDPSNNTTLQYQSISCMPAYAGTSFEEIRVQDYTQGRKTATTGTTNAFGQPSAFGSQTAGSSIFGGQQNTQPAQTNSIFGAPKPATGFGSFGNTNNTNTTSAFGTSNAFSQPQQPQPATTGFGAFGTQQQQQQQQPQQQGTGIFGSGNTGTSTFGNTAGNAFGGGAGAFGTQPQQPQQTGGSIFGQTQPAANTGSTFGAFGNPNNAAKPSVFGQSAAQTGASIFGQPAQQNQQQAPQQSSLFGASNAGGGLFGGTNQQQQQQQPQPQNSLFGNAQNANNTGTGTGGLFGGGSSIFGANNQQQQQPQQPQAGTTGFGGGLFGAKPAAPAGGGLFGGGAFGAQQPAANPQQPSLFGNNAFGQSANNQQQQPAAGGLFANKAPSMGMSTSGTGGGLFGGSMFGNSTNSLASSTATPQQGGLIASITQPIAPNLFSMLPPGPRAVDLEQSTKKKVPFFVDVPTRSPVPRVQLGYTPANSKLRGFGSSLSGSPLNGSVFTPSNSTSLALSRSQTPKQSIEAIFGTQSSPSLGSGQRKSVKKLILDKKVEPTELFVRSGGSPLRGGAKITFSPALSIASREREAALAAAASSSSPSQPTKSPPPTPQPPQRTPKKFTASQSAQGIDEDDLQEGDYYVKPNMETLKSSGFDQLSSFKGLIVGRVGYGEILFLEPVDLTGLLKLGELLGGVVRFEDKECSVYPDADDTEKPPEGSGLNVRAKISLKRCWVMDKAHREPIKDEKHPSAVKHLKKLRNMKDTHFENFDISDGTWTFIVDHF